MRKESKKLKKRAKIWVIFIFSIILLTQRQQGTEEPEIRISSPF